jgi:hypothetical protein
MKKIILALWIAYIFMLVADYMATVKFQCISMS